MEGLVLKLHEKAEWGLVQLKPLVEGLVLKSTISDAVQSSPPEAPRGGAGIEIACRWTA